MFLFMFVEGVSEIMESSKLDPLLVRTYEQGDEQEMNVLFNEVFGKRRDLEMWKWRYFDNPSKWKTVRILAVVAELQHRIVGQYCAIPRLFKYKDSYAKTAQGLDNLIAPDHRSLKVQFEMSQYVDKIVAREGISVGFGFPNEVAYLVGKTFLDYRDLAEISVLFKRLNFVGSLKVRLQRLPNIIYKMTSFLGAYFFRIETFFKQIKHVKGLEIVPLERFTKDFDALWQKVKDKYNIIGVRDERYLNWRYVDRPRFSYTIFCARKEELEGFIILRTDSLEHHRVGYIVDFLYTKREIFKALLMHAYNYFISMRTDHVLCWGIEGREEYNILYENTFRPHHVSEPIKMVYKIYDKTIDEFFLCNPRNWFITYGDSEGI